jgi:hypothetical protein
MLMFQWPLALPGSPKFLPFYCFQSNQIESDFLGGAGKTFTMFDMASRFVLIVFSSGWFRFHYKDTLSHLMQLNDIKFHLVADRPSWPVTYYTRLTDLV